MAGKSYAGFKQLKQQLSKGKSERIKGYHGSKARKGAFVNPFPSVRAESRIAGGGERITEDDPRSKRR